jgi:pimeloyl-ACP methyl ester carboxylesterase
VTAPLPHTFGEIEDTSLPLAVLVHGFPDTPYTWRYLGPDLVERGYRVVAPWLPGYDAPTNRPISVGTYVRHVIDVRRSYRADERAILIGHDWGALIPDCSLTSAVAAGGISTCSEMRAHVIAANSLDA